MIGKNQYAQAVWHPPSLCHHSRKLPQCPLHRATQSTISLVLPPLPVMYDVLVKQAHRRVRDSKDVYLSKSELAASILKLDFGYWITDPAPLQCAKCTHQHGSRRQRAANNDRIKLMVIPLDNCPCFPAYSFGCQNAETDEHLFVHCPRFTLSR